MIHDIAIIGNGIFGNLFLYEINRHVNKSQNFSIAHIYEEKLAPACSYRTTSTVTKNGIEEDVSELGDLLVNSFYAFVDFFENNSGFGISKTKQFISAFDSKKIKKLHRRFKSQIGVVECPFVDQKLEGVALDSYLISPDLFFKKLNHEINSNKNCQINTYHSLAQEIKKSESENCYEIKIGNKEIIKARKLIIATGAYSKIFKPLFLNTNFSEGIDLTKIVSGSFLIKKAKFKDNIYLSLDGNNIIYRRETEELIIGSTTVEGAMTLPDLVMLNKIFNDLKKLVNIDLGNFEDYEVITGLRHKGQKRLPFFKAITDDNQVWFFNGAYKNGWSLPFYYLKKDIKKFI